MTDLKLEPKTNAAYKGGHWSKVDLVRMHFSCPTEHRNELLKISGNCGGFIEPFHEFRKGVANLKTKLTHKAVMLKAKAGIAGYLGLTKWGTAYVVRCTAESYEQAVGSFSTDELDSPLPQADMFLYKVQGLPWDVTGNGLKDLFKQAGLPQPIIMGVPYTTRNARCYNIAAAEEITQLQIRMDKGADVFLTAKGAGKGKGKGGSARRPPHVQSAWNAGPPQVQQVQLKVSSTTEKMEEYQKELRQEHENNAQKIHSAVSTQMQQGRTVSGRKSSRSCKP